jgi:hypothetical protein
MPLVADQQSKKLVGMITDHAMLLGHRARHGPKDHTN